MKSASQMPARSEWAPDAGESFINLGELWRVVRRRKKVVAVSAGAVVFISVLITGYQRLFRPVYQGAFSLLITDPISSSSEDGRGVGAVSGEGSIFEALARNTTRNDIPTLIEVLRSPVLLAPIAERFDLKVKALADRIEISTGGDRRKVAQGVLNVSLTGRDPDKTLRLLEALSQAYLQVALEQRQQRLADGLAFLNRQSPVLERTTGELQSELAAFRERHNLLEPTGEGAALKGRLAQMDAQLLALQAERSRLLKVRQEIASGSLSARGFQEGISTGSGDSGSTQGLSVSDADQSLLQQLIKVETELAEARSKYSSSSSMVQGLEARLNQLKPMLRENQLEAVDAALALNSGRLATAESQYQSLTNRFLKQPRLIKQYGVLDQKLKIAQDNLAGLSSARETFQLEIAQRSVPWRVIAPPLIEADPIAPSLKLNLSVGVLLGLMAGAGAGLIRDRFDHAFRYPGEVTGELDLPLLGHIPHVKFFQGVRDEKRFLLQELDQSVSSSGDDADARQQQRYQRFFYQEALRNLFTSLRFLGSDQPLKSVALTSSLPAEGKSLVNVLLAKTLSEMGQRVLLVDADLRKPQMHYRLGMNNLSGLSNVLTDDGQHWRNVVQNVPGYENWSLISAGRRPPDPTRLLSSQRMHQLVGELTSCGEFDLVLFDTPPILGLADAALVAEHCDGLILLVSIGYVDRRLPRESLNRVRSSGAPLLGIVTNALKEESSGTSAYSYDYDAYGYNGAYGYKGYGYAAYDTSATYAYYADAEEGGKSSSASSESAGSSLTAARWQPWRRELQRYWRKLIHWLDH